jgi:hypothetical protein
MDATWVIESEMRESAQVGEAVEVLGVRQNQFRRYARPLCERRFHRSARNPRSRKPLNTQRRSANFFDSIDGGKRHVPRRQNFNLGSGVCRATGKDQFGEFDRLLRFGIDDDGADLF